MDTSRRGGYKLESSNLSTLRFGTHYDVRCIRDDKIVWREEVDNLVVNTGLEYLLGSAVGNTEKANLYCGLCISSNVEEEDTMQSHLFREFTGTSSVERPLSLFEPGITINGVASYVATDVQQFIFEPGSLRGIFLTDNKWVGADTGLLFGVASFTEEKTVISGDSLLVTITISAEG